MTDTYISSIPSGMSSSVQNTGSVATVGGQKNLPASATTLTSALLETTLSSAAPTSSSSSTLASSQSSTSTVALAHGPSKDDLPLVSTSSTLAERLPAATWSYPLPASPTKASREEYVSAWARTPSRKRALSPNGESPRYNHLMSPDRLPGLNLHSPGTALYKRARLGSNASNRRTSDATNASASSRRTHARPLSTSSSFTAVSASSRAGTPSLEARGHVGRTQSFGGGLVRGASVASFGSQNGVQRYPELSAKHFMKRTKVVIDFSVPTTAAPNPSTMVAAPAPATAPPVLTTALTTAAGGNTHTAVVPGTLPTVAAVTPPFASFTPTPVAWSAQNILLFTRGNRVHFKNAVPAPEEVVGQLCKVPANVGVVKVIACPGGGEMSSAHSSSSLSHVYSSSGSAGSSSSSSYNNLVALGTSKGYVQIWDVAAKRMTVTFPGLGGSSSKHGSTNDATSTLGDDHSVIASMAWYAPGHILSVGGGRGIVRHYDVRMNTNTGKCAVKEHTPRKATRHQARVGVLGWSIDGRCVASGDDAGVVYVWDGRMGVGPIPNATEESMRKPMDVGEFGLGTTRRKKIWHTGAVTALNWCPWQPKLLATGDASGNVRLWNINTNVPTHTSAANQPSSDAADPGGLLLGAPVTALWFAPHVKELVATCGEKVPVQDANSSDRDIIHDSDKTGTITVHAYPSLQHVVSETGAASTYQNTLPSAGTSSSTVLPRHSLSRSSSRFEDFDSDDEDIHNLNSTPAAPAIAPVKAITGAVLSPCGSKIAVAVAAEGKLHVWDVSGKPSNKRRELRRAGSTSFLDGGAGIR